MRRKTLRKEYAPVPCPNREDPRVWGNPHEWTGKYNEAYEHTTSREEMEKRRTYFENNWKKQVKEHKEVMRHLRKAAAKCKTRKQLLAEGWIDEENDDATN